MYSANAGKSVFGVLVLGFLFFASGVENIAQAQQIFYAALDGAQETPANVSPATGTGTVVLNAAETQITVSLEFSALGSAQTAAHIHSPAARGVAAGVIIGLPNGTFINQTFAVTAGQVGTASIISFHASQALHRRAARRRCWHARAPFAGPARRSAGFAAVGRRDGARVLALAE